ncbi:MAG: MurT ligase domain-containing protein, partial [Methanobacteriaceae archaeon]|nr:MurT ligase domain-containing protein [Methanobacteriaceae archaeon]
GKTTTNNLLTHVIKGQYSVLSNLRGANMPQGLVSAYLNDLDSYYDWGVFEVDEGSFERVVQDIKPDYVVITNFFRDQLDRYGEIEKAFQDIFESLVPLDTTLILNADDPLVSNFQKMGKRSVYYGVGENQFSNSDQSVVETNFCPSCNSRLGYTYFNYGQLGEYNCPKCGFSNPSRQYEIKSIDYKDPGYDFQFQIDDSSINVSFQYEGIYNAYNCCAAMATAREIGMNLDLVVNRIESFKYYLGRMENFKINGKNVKVALVKNPIGLGEVLKTLSLEENTKNLLMILNDNPADSTDVSWIWDAEVEAIKNVKNLKSINFSGKRPYDMALRFKYTGIPTDHFKVKEDMDQALEMVLNDEVNTVYILPTYTAVFQVRELLKARMEGKGKFMSHLRESLKNLRFPGLGKP